MRLRVVLNYKCEVLVSCDTKAVLFPTTRLCKISESGIGSKIFDEN